MSKESVQAPAPNANTKSAPPAERTATLETIVGLFVAVVFFALAVFTIVISGSALFNKKLTTITVVIPDAMGLRRNDPVIARGTSVGTVGDVFYQEDGVHVQAILSAPVVLHEGYDITVVSTSILGGRQLVIREGDDDAPVVTDMDRLVGRKPSDLFESATEIVEHVNQGEGPLGRIIYDDNMASNLAEIVANFRAISADVSNMTARVQSGEGLLGRLFYDDNLATNIAVAIADLRSVANDISNVTAKVQSGEGTIGRLVYDDTLASDLSSAIASLKEISGRLENGEGSLGKLLAKDDTALYDDLKATIANLRAISDRLEKGEGSLGKLLSNDTALYDNVNGIVIDAREYLDDLRETTPLSTFSTFIFGAF